MRSPAGALLPIDEEDRRAAAHIAAGAALLKPSWPKLAEFFQALFRDAPPEDVTRFTPASLAELAERVFDRSKTRKPGETLVTLFNFRAEGEDLVRNETVLVAVNDDRPFLFDSLIGEVSAQGARVHALFHPVVTATRDANGARAAKGASQRESVIVLVLQAMMSEERQAALIKGAEDVFTQVRLAVRDWGKMQSHLAETIETLQDVSAAGVARGARRKPRLSQLAGRQSFHLSGLPRLRLRGHERRPARTHRGIRAGCARRRRDPRHPARQRPRRADAPKCATS